MPKYIKSHSNYVLKSFHQSINDGTIYERDITTIGGVGNFPSSQVPIYRSNNFIITVRNDSGISNQYNTKEWNKNSTSGDIWTVSSLEGLVSTDDNDNDTKIVLKQDYYDFCDFCYYGSLSEMLRSSITDIINRFPGELYGTTNNVYYTETKTVDGSIIETRKKLGGEENNYKYVVNPFKIDIHSRTLPDGANPLKYFANDGYKNYNYIVGNTKTQVTWSVSYENKECFIKGDKLATITINGITIYAYLGDDNIVYYLSSSSDFHIRPNDNINNSFYNECDNFQRLLLNPKTTPKYKALFSVIKENENGYYREFEEFVFPTSEGGYNIDATSYGFNTYTSRLSDIGSFYDEYFTDNLYRSMTHEAIKNFDWTYTREYVEGDEEEYVIGGEKMQKALRIFAREFDETLAYINNIRNTNRITYDERSNLPDYFLTDALENEGWSVRLVIPYDKNGNTNPPSSSECDVLSRKFVQSSGTVTPYTKNKLQYPNGYFIGCCSDGTVPCGYNNGVYKLSVASADEYTRIDSCGYNSILRNRIKAFSDEREYSYNEVNSEFLRRLKLNSRYIWRHKGTLDGIDMILGMFGLKNKKFVDELSGTCKQSDYDYEITEYIASSNTITDRIDSVHQMYRIDWINSTKTITYDYRSLSNYNRDGIDVNYLSYQGLPVIYKQNTSTRTLYPNFSKLEQYDGNPYFQMNGGWQDKAFKYNNKYYSFQFDVDDNIVYSTKDELFKETVRNIRRFDTLEDMLSVPSYEVTNGQIVYVSYIQDNIAVLAGKVYNIKIDSFGRYIELIKSNGVVRAGDDYFFDEIIRVFDRNKNVSTVNINEIPNGQVINCYIVNNTIQCYDDYKNCSHLFDVIGSNTSSTSANTNYFTIADFSQSNRLYNSTYSSGGWRRLSLGEAKCKMISTIVNDDNGNNPHNGMMIYDNGREYFKYYEQLFKYAIEYDMFDERCYDNFDNTLSTEISKYGFTFVKANNDYNRQDYYHKDRKISAYVNGNKNVITNNIFNTKVIKITFKLHNQLFSSNGQGDCEMKYIDDVVMNYLTQMIPSTAILQIRYTN